MGQIKLDFEKVMGKVNEILGVSEEIRNISNEINNIIEMGNNSWRGQAAYEFMQSCLLLQNEINKTADDVESLAKKIRFIASTIKETDDQIVFRKIF